MSSDFDLDRKDREIESPAAWQPFPPGVIPGAVVRVRGATWRVISCDPYDDCGVVHLHNQEDDRTLLSPFDRLEPLPHQSRIRRVGMQRWARTIAALIAERRSRATLHVAHSTAAILPYQLDPAVALARGASSVLLADEVGLGKTVQAGWAIADLLAREPNARVLVCAPAGLLTQWADELQRHFSIPSTRVDASWLRRRVASVPADVSPWCLGGVYVASIDFVKRPDVREALSRHVWDALLVDEAHGAAAPTERHQALAAIAASSLRLVLITATPFAGDVGAFQSLRALGAAGKCDMPVFRRSRLDVENRTVRSHRFHMVRLAPPEVRLQRALERYTSEVWRQASSDTSGHARLAMTVLRKRALSSAAAVGRSLRRRATLLAGLDPSPRQLVLFEDEEDAADGEPTFALAAPGLEDTTREQRWLGTLIALADGAASTDAKRRLLHLLLRRTRENAAIVFTEYRDTLHDLSRDFPTALQLHGGLTRAERETVQRRFNDEGGLLLATDAASEGLNLQGRCRLVINYELPWSPARLEQRIGRVDRIGQQRRVHAISLVARDSAEDLVIANLLRRLSRVAATLGARDRLATFLDETRVAQAVIGGIPIDVTGSDALPAVALQSVVSVQAAHAAEQLRVLRRIGAATAWRCEQEMVVTRVRGSRALNPGALFVIAWHAVTADGQTRASDLILVHVSNTLDPRDPAVLRDVASASRGSAARLLARCVDEQHDFNTGLASRMRDIENREACQEEAQPGLFDKSSSSSRNIVTERGPVADCADLRSELRLVALLFVGTAGRAGR